MSRRAAAVALVALLVAGCGGGDPSPGGDTTTDGPAGAGLRFAQCMRDNGVPAFPDPPADGGGLTVDAIANGTSIDTDGPAWEGAVEACRALQPAGFTGRTRDDDQQSAALRFAQCIREQGITDFPDPDPGDPLVDTRRVPSFDQPGGKERLDTAMRTCGGRFGEQAGVTAP